MAMPEAPIERELIVLQKAVTAARISLASWREPDGIPTERCLAELLALFFDPALDASLQPSRLMRKDPLGVLRRAVVSTKQVLLAHYSEARQMDGETCLVMLNAVMNMENLLQAGDFPTMIEADRVCNRVYSRLGGMDRNVIPFPTAQ